MSTTHYLAGLFEPRAIAVIGASEKEGSIGHVIFRNLLASGYRGQLLAVNPRHTTLLGQPCVPDIESAGTPLDLALIPTAPRTIAEIIDQCGQDGIRNTIVVSHHAA